MSKAIFCKNGHDLSIYDPIPMGYLTMRRVIAMAERQRYHDQIKADPFCPKCGAPTMTVCEHCNSQIKVGNRPAYCVRCGKPMPWTETAIEAAKEYTDELEKLTAEEKTALKGTLAII